MQNSGLDLMLDADRCSPWSGPHSRHLHNLCASVQIWLRLGGKNIYSAGKFVLSPFRILRQHAAYWEHLAETDQGS
jgi:hypothetical protein